MTGIDHSHALAELEAFFARPAAGHESFLTITNLAIRLAAHGHAEAVLAMAQQASEKVLFHPLVEGLRLHLGLVIQSTGAARSLAIYIASQIRQEVQLHGTAA